MPRAGLNIFGRTVADLALIAACSLPLLFLSLGALPIVLCDESRLANNAIEMYQDGFSLVTTYLHHPDLWNTKPPLLIWLMAAFFHIFGPSEWALRLPSALAALATCCMVYCLCRNVTRCRLAGIAGALVLMTTYGFVAPHVARTGDYDSLLIFFTTTILASCYRILEVIRAGERPTRKLLTITALALAGGIMTKGIAGLLILPGIALAALAGGVTLKTFADWRIWFAACGPLVLAGCFYFAREAVDPGYIRAVWANELGGRFMSQLADQDHPAVFYLIELFRPWTSQKSTFYLGSAVPWIWSALIFLPFGIRNAQTGPATKYLAIVLAVFLIIISAAKTKFTWYAAPAYPVMACLTVISGFACLQRISPEGKTGLRQHARRVLAGLFFCVIATVGWAVIERTCGDIARAADNPDLRSAAFVRRVMPSDPKGDALRIVRAPQNETAYRSPSNTQYSPQEEFYASLMRVRGIDAAVVTPDYQPRPGDLLMWCSPTPLNAPQPLGGSVVSHGPCHLDRSTGANAPVITR
jgi:4-amino-4-deoxy-L-arabinose transferase-like glycosyltransferase